MKRILILEDDIDLGNYWKSILELEGHRVFHETQVEHAIEVLKDHTIDLVITDMLIGTHQAGFHAKGGLSLLSHISLEMGESRPRCIGTTGASSDLALDRHAELFKVDCFLEKPIEEHVLVQTIANLLSTKCSK